MITRRRTTSSLLLLALLWTRPAKADCSDAVLEALRQAQYRDIMSSTGEDVKVEPEGPFKYVIRLIVQFFVGPTIRKELATPAQDMISNPGRWVVLKAAPEGKAANFIRGLGGGIGLKGSMTAHLPGVGEAMTLMSGVNMGAGSYAYVNTETKFVPGTGYTTVFSPLADDTKGNSGFARPVTVMGYSSTFTDAAGNEARLPTYNVDNVYKIGIFFPTSTSAETVVPWAKAYLTLARELEDQGVKPKDGSVGQQFLTKLEALMKDAADNKRSNTDTAADIVKLINATK